jgi:hypothetical protein
MVEASVLEITVVSREFLDSEYSVDSKDTVRSGSEEGVKEIIEFDEIEESREVIVIETIGSDEVTAPKERVVSAKELTQEEDVESGIVVVIAVESDEISAELDLVSKVVEKIDPVDEDDSESKFLVIFEEIGSLDVTVEEWILCEVQD